MTQTAAEQQVSGVVGNAVKVVGIVAETRVGGTVWAPGTTSGAQATALLRVAGRKLSDAGYVATYHAPQRRGGSPFLLFYQPGA